MPYVNQCHEYDSKTNICLWAKRLNSRCPKCSFITSKNNWRRCAFASKQLDFPVTMATDEGLFDDETVRRLESMVKVY